MVKGWAANITPLYDRNIYKKYFEQLPDFRKEKAAAQAVEQKRIQSVAAWSLWTKIRETYGVLDEAVFNLSHSGNFVMCAVCMEKEQTGKPTVSVGCDIQQMGGLREQVAKHYFCSTEYEEIMAGKTGEERKERFYRYWVLKESFLKATRWGMKLPLDSFEIRLGNPPVLIRKPELFKEDYCYREYKLPNGGYRMAICSTQQKIADDIDMELEL